MLAARRLDAGAGWSVYVEAMAEQTSAAAALLERAEQAHRGGHFAQVRTLLKELAASGTLTAQEQQQAQALRARLRPDPLVAVLILICVLLFISVVTATWR